MSRNHTKALKVRWAKASPESRASAASNAAKARWQNATPDDRKAQGKMLAKSRKVSHEKIAAIVGENVKEIRALKNLERKIDKLVWKQSHQKA